MIGSQTKICLNNSMIRLHNLKLNLKVSSIGASADVSVRGLFLLLP